MNCVFITRTCDVISLTFSQDFSSSIYLAWFFPQLSVYFCCFWHQELLLRQYIQLKTEQIKEWKPWTCATILKINPRNALKYETKNGKIKFAQISSTQQKSTSVTSSTFFWDNFFKFIETLLELFSSSQSILPLFGGNSSRLVWGSAFEREDKPKRSQVCHLVWEILKAYFL